MPRPSERTLVVVNFNAARARRAWPGIREQLTRAGLRFEVDAPASPDETEPAVRRALCEGFRTIAVVGGDGTLSAAARGFFDTHEGSREPSSLNPSEPHAPPDTPALPPSSELCAPPAPVNSSAALAVLPAGTGDDFARGLAGRRAHLDEWLRRLVAHCRRSEEDGAGSARSVDVLCAEVDGGARRFVCLNAATLGVGAEVASRVAAQGPAARRLPGEARFALAAAGALVAWRNRTAHIELDGEPALECSTNLVAVANGPYAGGGMNFAPGARPDDGRLEALAVCRIARGELIRELARVHRGGHLANPKVLLRQATFVRVSTPDPADALPVEADGDPRGRTPAAFRLMPSALRVVV